MHYETWFGEKKKVDDIKNAEDYRDRKEDTAPGTKVKRLVNTHNSTGRTKQQPEKRQPETIVGDNVTKSMDNRNDRGQETTHIGV